MLNFSYKYCKKMSFLSIDQSIYFSGTVVVISTGPMEKVGSIFHTNTHFFQKACKKKVKLSIQSLEENEFSNV